MTDAIEVRACLQRRRVELHDEIRHYPTPIARCDQHLTALLEARDEVSALLRLTDDAALLDAYAAVASRWEDQGNRDRKCASAAMSASETP